MTSPQLLGMQLVCCKRRLKNVAPGGRKTWHGGMLSGIGAFVQGLTIVPFYCGVFGDAWRPEDGSFHREFRGSGSGESFHSFNRDAEGAAVHRSPPQRASPADTDAEARTCVPVPPWRPSSPIYARRRSSLGLDDRQPLSSYPANSCGSRLNDFDGIDLAADWKSRQRTCCASTLCSPAFGEASVFASMSVATNGLQATLASD